MKTAELIKSLEANGRLLARAAAEAGPDAEVPTCPGWRVRDLLRHTGMVHRWATAFVVEGYTTFHPDGGEPDLDGDALVDWFGEGHASLVGALIAAPADLTCWTFVPVPSPLDFWARRQAHETAVHRLDAESALPEREPGTVDPEFAVDGIDELLRMFHTRPKSRVRTNEPKTLRVRATDTGDVWTARLSAEPMRTDRTDIGSADCEVSGSAGLLYSTLWNRRPLSSVSVAGDGTLARLWRDNSGITWS
ncbi:maleylpyruvate isomerase family mycothiol-dependent enzyme [Streptomyces sp. NPDC051320]|uniref:maleylpyruvate isomerase family mycothiol-dependent enzyme n=1 Tax=Streptomyces sp. NPDC051320 TaxID=3154644 RepID=UPI00343CF273